MMLVIIMAATQIAFYVQTQNAVILCHVDETTYTRYMMTDRERIKVIQRIMRKQSKK